MESSDREANTQAESTPYSPEAARTSSVKAKSRARDPNSSARPTFEGGAILGERELAAKLSLAPATLRNWRVTGLGPRFVRLSARAVRYRGADVETWLSARVRRSTSEADRDDE
jgi:predicted DNA-binding transcriptional regulator AlpA